MSFVQISQVLNLALGALLVIRLVSLRLERVYTIFCLFLGCELLVSLVEFFSSIEPNLLPDYRITWLTGRVVIWILTLWTVYALLGAVLAELPGILGLSRKVLNLTFLAAGAVGILTVRPEYSLSGAAAYTDPVARAVAVGFVLDRVVCSVALLALLLILGFLLWFPVQISKNLIVFTTGFIVYFAAKGSLLIMHSVWSHESLSSDTADQALRRLVSNLIMFVSSACFAYWAIFITRQGETVPIRIGHLWQRHDQERMIGQLEAMNAALLRAAARR
jgi:hypothetical protein